jgi:signal transduction histidine kinase/ActR/RegA family two-component response regulator
MAIALVGIVPLAAFAVFVMVELALWRSLVLFGALLAVALAATAFAARYLARHIARSIEGAALAADTTGARQVAPAPPSRIREIEALNAALRAASERLAGARVEARGLGNVASALSGTLELPRMLEAVAEEARRVTRSDLVRIALPSGNPGEMIYRYLVGTRAAGYDAIRPREGRGFVGYVMQTRQPYRTADAPKDPLVKTVQGRNMLGEEGTRSALVVPILEQGELQGVIYAGRRKVQPFTDDEERACMRLAAQAALALRNARLYEIAQAAREEAEAASRAKDEFLAMLSHELRNPLGAISMAAHLLERLPLPEQAGSAQKIIARQSAHLGKILDDLLDVGGAISGKVALRRQRIELGAVVRAAVAHFETPERVARPRLMVDTEPAWVDADPARIEQIVVNLVGNAMKFTPEDGEVRVRVRAAGSEALIEVRDDGIGIPPAMLERVFDLFAQAHAEPARGRGGLGVGLTITRRLVELHGGSIGVESPGEGRGACFTVRLPLAQAAADHATPHAAAEPAGQKLDLLVVEDNADARETLVRYLELLGNSVRACANGAEALAAAATRVPDAAILDVGLPDFDGYTLAARLRQRHGGRMVLAALTGYGQAGDRLKAEQAGFDTHFTKPVEPGRMLDVLQGLARRRA